MESILDFSHEEIRIDKNVSMSILNSLQVLYILTHTKMTKYILSVLVGTMLMTSSLFAYESTIAFDNKIDTVVDAIMDIMVTKNEAYGDKVVALLQSYKAKFATDGNDRNHYISNRLLLQLTNFHQCTTAGGTWLTVVNECEYINEDQCDVQDGTFHECGSACRHQEDEATVCTLQCVPYCEIELDYTIPESTN